MPSPAEPSSPPESTTPAGPSPDCRAVALDLSRHARLPQLSDMLAAMSRAAEPEHAYQAFFDCIRKVHGKKGFLCLETMSGDGADFRITHLVSVDGRNAVDHRSSSSEPGDSRAQGEDGMSRGGFVSDVIAPPPTVMGAAPGTAAAALARPVLYIDLHIKNDAVLGNQLLMYRSAMIAPLHRFGRIGGWVWVLGLQTESFKEMHVEDFVLRCNVLAAALDRIDRATRLRDAEDRLSRQTARVSHIQRSFRPETLPEIRGIDIRAHHEAVGKAGGDFYLVYPTESMGRAGGAAPGSSSSLHPLPPGEGRGEGSSAGADLRTGFLLATVFADGPAAAMIMAMMDGVMSTLPHKALAAADVLNVLNRHLSARRVEGASISAFLAFYDPATRRLDYALAAHPPALVRRPPLRGDIQMAVLGGEGGGAASASPAGAAAYGGPPLATDPQASYARSSFQLAPDDTMLLVSTGVMSAPNEAGESLGMERISGLFQRSSGNAADALDHLLRALRQHEPPTGAASDQTLIAARVNY